MVFMAKESSQKLQIMAISVISEGIGFENPSVYFRPTAQTPDFIHKTL
jgi:hypothetical protein